MARARDELDGLRRPGRPFNPLTIIQVKNAERNHDSSQDNSCWMQRRGAGLWHTIRSRRLYMTASLFAGFVMVGLTLWALPNSPDEMLYANRHRRDAAHWTRVFENISKFSFSTISFDASGAGKGINAKYAKCFLLSLRTKFQSVQSS